MPAISVDDSLDYSPKEISSGSYVLRNVNPETTQPVIALNSTTNTEFLLPNTVFNLYNSFLNFNILINDGANTGADNRLVAHSGFLAPIDGISLSTNAGIKLVELNNVPEYTKLVWRAETDLQQFLTHPPHSYGEATVAAVTEAGQLFGRNRTINAAIAADLAAATMAASSGHNSANDGTAFAVQDDAYNTVQTWVASILETAGNGAGSVGVRVQLPLKMLYGSLFAMNKDLFFNEQLRLTIRWNQGAKFGASFDDQGAANFATATASTDLLDAPTVSSVLLRLAVETSEPIISSIKQRVMLGEGLNLNMPFTYAYKFVSSAQANDSNTVIRKLNRGHGSKLLRVFAGIYSAANIGTRYCNLYNVAAQKWSNYRCFIDSKPIQDEVLAVTDYTAWQYHANKLRGSVVKSVKDWNQNPVIIEDFSGVALSKDYPLNDHMSSGLDLVNEREFALQYTNVIASLPCYIFCVCLKQLSITNQGISVM